MSTFKVNTLQNLAGTKSVQVEDLADSVTSEVANSSPTKPTWDTPLVLTDLTSPTLASVGIQGANPEARLYPNGDVVGSSANGDFTKYANGDLVLINKQVAPAVTATWTYPILFNVTPICQGTHSSGGSPGAFIVSTAALNVSYCTFEAFTSSGSSANVNCFLTANGRWKA